MATEETGFLGPVAKMTKSKARSELAAIVLGVNNQSPSSGISDFQEFVQQVFLPEMEALNSNDQ